MSDLVTWLRACLDEDEQVANAVVDHLKNGGGRGFSLDKGDLPEPVRRHILHTTPGRLRADVAAKLAILDLHVGGVSYPDECGLCNETLPCETVRLLAQPFADRPGYDEAWRP